MIDQEQPEQAPTRSADGRAIVGAPGRRRMLGAGVICALGCVSLLAGCALVPSKTKQKASVYVGQSIDAAIADLGPPSSRMPRNGDIDGTSGWEYVWSNMYEGTDRYFVQTGSEHTGTSMVGVTPGGNGVAPMPIYQDNYRPTGHYENYMHGCMLFIKVDPGGIVEKVETAGDKC